MRGRCAVDADPLDPGDRLRDGDRLLDGLTGAYVALVLRGEGDPRRESCEILERDSERLGLAHIRDRLDREHVRGSCDEELDALPVEVGELALG